MTQRTEPLPARQSAARAFNQFGLTNFLVGAKSGNVINVAVQLQDARGQTLRSLAHAKCYLSDNSDGSTLTATASTSPFAIGVNGVLLDITTTGKVFSVVSNASGQFDVNITQTAGGTNQYLVVIHPAGGITVSPIIAF
jgi:hypothetical protein